MAGHGPAPKLGRQNKYDVRLRGNPKAAEGAGWQHGPIPDPPTGLLLASRDAWQTWMASWFAAHWTPADLPGLRQVIRLYDQVERKEFQRATELRLAMDTYGITPKGQQDRRWLPPEDAHQPQKGADDDNPYAHLRIVSG